MDDLELRRRCIADPSDRDEGFQRAKENKTEYMRLAEEQTRFDRQLKDVMESVDVPGNLAARIKLNHAMNRRALRHRIWTRSLALAASIFVGLAVALFFHTSPPDVQQVVLTHVYSELDHLDYRRDVQLSDLQKLLQTAGTELQQGLGRIHYAGICQLPKQTGVHLVLEGKGGPVTVIFMPGEQVANRSTIKDDRFRGVIVPTPKGSMAIVGEDRESIEETEHKLQSSLHWRV